MWFPHANAYNVMRNAWSYGSPPPPHLSNSNVVFGSVFVFYNDLKLAVKESTDNVYCKEHLPPLPHLTPPKKNLNNNKTNKKTEKVPNSSLQYKVGYSH